MTIKPDDIPTISVNYQATGASTSVNPYGMRPMQERAWQRRGEQYLLIKSPPASGKSRALMFIALDKLHNQSVTQAIIVVPERSIGASFADEPLSQHGFFADWTVVPRWNLCDASGTDEGKVAAVGSFLASEDRVLVCTHASFRFAVDRFGIEAFDDRLIAVDEFHHVSVAEDNVLGRHLTELIARGKVHVVAMTGSYFRGDAEAVLTPSDETKFETVTYTYYEQLNGYQYLKRLDIGYFFYSGSYVDDILKVLDPAEKTIVHIPNVNSRESTQDKLREVETILHSLGTWEGTEPATGFQLVREPGGRLLRIADLVDDEPVKRNRVMAALKDPAQKSNRDHVDIIIALGMAKEGFDWIWCEHALTVGYRSSLTEIVQIIGRATRDAPGKTRARFTNLIAEPDASEQAVTEAVNDTLKAIAASLLMEQVLAPRFEFRPKNPTNTATEGFDYGKSGYDPEGKNIGFNPDEGKIQIEISGLTEPKSEQAKRIIKEDLNELIAAVVQDKETIEHGIFDKEMMPQEITQVQVGKIVRERHPDLDENDQEAVRQRVIAAMAFTQEAKRAVAERSGEEEGDQREQLNTAIIDGVRRFAMDVRSLDIDLIDSINPFGEAYSILSKAMTEERLRQVQAIVEARRIAITPEEAKGLASRAVMFKKDRNRLPSLTAADPWERRMAEGAKAFMRFKSEGKCTVSDLDLDHLAAELADFAEPVREAARSPVEERVLAGFEEIQRWVAEHGRRPEHGEGRDIFERLYSVRLDRICGQPELRAIVEPLDHQNLLAGTPSPAPDGAGLSDDELVAELAGIEEEVSDLTTLRHVRSRKEIEAAEEIASRKPCADFATFRPLFERVQEEIKSGVRTTLPFNKDIGFNTDARVRAGDYFILGGQFVHVAEMDEVYRTPEGAPQARLRLIYGNGTESNLLIRSLQAALYKDPAGRRVTPPNDGPLFDDEANANR